MKLNLKNITAIFVLVITLYSCSSDNESTIITGNGTLNVEFDNIYGDADLAFNTPYNKSNGEIIKINELKYIISNIVLTKEDGTIYTVPKSESYYIINEADAASSLISIPNVPAGNYTKIAFGIGVDEAQFNEGVNGQGNLLTRAQDLGMTWSWAAGYKFIKFEGSYTSAVTTTETTFKVHTGKTGDIYNYASTALNLPVNALVRTNITPKIHIMANAANIINGTTTINFDEGASVMGGVKVQQIMANNTPNMFSIHHVHND